MNCDWLLMLLMDKKYYLITGRTKHILLPTKDEAVLPIYNSAWINILNLLRIFFSTSDLHSAVSKLSTIAVNTYFEEFKTINLQFEVIIFLEILLMKRYHIPPIPS